MTEVDVAPAVGDRLTIDGIEYVVNRVTVQAKSTKTDAGSAQALLMAKSESRQGRVNRAQIDLIPVAEIHRRRDSLLNLLEGVPMDEDD